MRYESSESTKLDSNNKISKFSMSYLSYEELSMYKIAFGPPIVVVGPFQGGARD